MYPRSINYKVPPNEVDMINRTVTAKDGHVWVWTEKGEARWDFVSCMRRYSGGYTRVAGGLVDVDLRKKIPMLWVHRGYVKQIKKP